MDILKKIENVKGLAEPLASGRANTLAADIGAALEADVYASSLAIKDSAVWFLAKKDGRKMVGQLCLDCKSCANLVGETVQINLNGKELPVKMGPTNPTNAAVLRENLSFTVPVLIGLSKSFGGGDRLGLASPAHIRAARGKPLRVFLAQQSIREMSRTNRSPQNVMDDASWAVLQEGFRGGFGSDADHLKSTEDIDHCLKAGFTLFTIDPGEHVDDEADRLGGTELQERFGAIRWNDLETTGSDCLSRYADKTIELPDGVSLSISKEEICRAVVKYGAAVAHTAKMHRHLLSQRAENEFELEMSVDETDSPTSLAEHFYVACELRRLGIKPVSLAPRFVGDFEKGVDYKGNPQEFERSLVGHVAIAKHVGPYKMSLHSGSDKFSIYPIAARVAGDLVHVKTAGTSYLEALRTISRVEPELFREILAFAFERYAEDKATYHVSAVPSKVPQPQDLKDSELSSVLDLFDGRQLLHVTYGSVLQAKNTDGSDRFRDRVLTALRSHEEEHYQIVADHITKHIEPFC